jgi:hypothetical protein
LLIDFCEASSVRTWIPQSAHLHLVFLRASIHDSLFLRQKFSCAWLSIGGLFCCLFTVVHLLLLLLFQWDWSRAVSGLPIRNPFFIFPAPDFFLGSFPVLCSLSRNLLPCAQGFAWFLCCRLQLLFWKLHWLYFCARPGRMRSLSFVFTRVPWYLSTESGARRQIFSAPGSSIQFIFLPPGHAPAAQFIGVRRLRVPHSAPGRTWLWCDLLYVLEGIIVGRCRYNSWVTESKDFSICSLNHFFMVIFRTWPPGVRWNICEDINCYSIWFLSSILHVVLLAPIRVSVVVHNLVPRVNSCSIAIWSWLC